MPLYFLCPVFTLLYRFILLSASRLLFQVRNLFVIGLPWALSSSTCAPSAGWGMGPGLAGMALCLGAGADKRAAIFVSKTSRFGRESPGYPNCSKTQFISKRLNWVFVGSSEWIAAPIAARAAVLADLISFRLELGVVIAATQSVSADSTNPILGNVTDRSIRDPCTKTDFATVSIPSAIPTIPRSAGGHE